MKVLAFDTETTGLIENHTIKLDRLPEVIEFFGHIVDLKTGKVGRKLDTFIKPRKNISEEITKITGINDQDVADAPPFVEVADVIEDLISRADVVLAHNLSYDMEMVDTEFERLGRKIKWPKGRICTVEQTIHLKGHRLSLSALHSFLFKEEFTGAHRARVDVAALTRCARELFKRGLL